MRKVTALCLPEPTKHEALCIASRAAMNGGCTFPVHLRKIDKKVPFWVKGSKGGYIDGICPN
jgi:hypothetical protein